MSNSKPIIYKQVKKGLYTIDEYGNIYSNYKKDFLKPNEDKDGYLKIVLSRGSRSNREYVRIATLVAWHYLGPPPEDMEDPTVNHIDWNIKNNYYLNLEWMPRKVNSSTRKNKGVGGENPQAKLNEKQVLEIKKLLKYSNLSLKQIGEQFGVSKSSISNISRGKNWSHVILKEEDKA